MRKRAKRRRLQEAKLAKTVTRLERRENNTYERSLVTACSMYSTPLKKKFTGDLAHLEYWKRRTH